jgi:hypothetical protein
MTKKYGAGLSRRERRDWNEQTDRIIGRKRAQPAPRNVEVTVKAGQTFQGVIYFEAARFMVSPEYAAFLVRTGVAEKNQK